MNQKACLIMSLVYFSVMSWLELVVAREVELTIFKSDKLTRACCTCSS